MEAGISVRGPIETGDATRFVAMLNDLLHARPGAQILVVDLDTPGGMVQEGEAMATIIKLNGYSTGIYPGSTCASACSLMFFAGSKKVFGAGARIGVHRASLSNSHTETADTIDTSLSIAESLRSLGASKSVVAKLLATPPNGMSWLTAGDLVGVRGVIFGPPPQGQDSDEFEDGWQRGRDIGACPDDMTEFANGCRAGAATVATSIPSLSRRQ
jgi:hypothetical protein